MCHFTLSPSYGTQACKVDVLHQNRSRRIHNKSKKVNIILPNTSNEDLPALLYSIKASAKRKDLRNGSMIHSHIVHREVLDKDITVGAALISMYAKCGALAEAQDVFDELKVQDVVAWSALIAGYVLHGHGNEAFNRFSEMHSKGVSPNEFTFASILKACGLIKSIKKGEEVHGEIQQQGLLRKMNNIVLSTALVDMYAKCGDLTKAQSIFHEIPARDVVCWNVLITGYVDHSMAFEALDCFDKMLEDGVSPNAVTFACALKACAISQAVEKGETIHTEMKKRRILQNNMMLGTTLVDMYAKCGALEKAQSVFDELPIRDVVSWTALISGYIEQGCFTEALNCFEKMLSQDLLPNDVTFMCILKACGGLGLVQKVAEIHKEIEKQKLLEKNVGLGNVLIDTYSKCGELAKAQNVFDELPVWDVVSWNVLIKGYVQYGLDEQAITNFTKMQDEGISPNTATFACILKSIGNLKSLEKGEKIHAMIEKQGVFEKDILIGTTLVDMYMKCGAVTEAQTVFEGLSVRNTVSWTTLIDGYAQNGHSTEAIKCYERMCHEGFQPDAVTYVCILKACGSLGSSEMGQVIHAEVRKQGLLENNIILGNAVVDMFVKCGLLLNAQDVFDNMAVRDIITWNILIAGYAQIGNIKTVLSLYVKMISEDQVPDVITFVDLLASCSHAGLVEDGQMYFKSMKFVYFLTPMPEHYVCMVDLFSRAGHFDKAMDVIQNVPPGDCFNLWVALLGGCHKWVNVELGRQAFDHLIVLDAKYIPAYVYMSNIYATVGMQHEATIIETMRLKNITEE